MNIRFLGPAEHGRQLEEALRVLREYEAEGEYLLVEVRAEKLAVNVAGETVYVDFAEVLFVESFGHDIYVHTRGGTHVTRTTLAEMEKLLPPARFCRISQSVIVNLGAVVRRSAYLAGRCFLTLENGQQVTVTRSYFSLFKGAIRSWIRY